MPTVNNSRTADVIVEGVHLKPGANEITDEQAKTLRESAAYKRHARRHWLGGLDLTDERPAAVAVTVQKPDSAAATATPATPPAPSKPEPDHDTGDRFKSRPPGSKR